MSSINKILPLKTNFIDWAQNIFLVEYGIGTQSFESVNYLAEAGRGSGINLSFSPFPKGGNNEKSYNLSNSQIDEVTFDSSPLKAGSIRFLQLTPEDILLNNPELGKLDKKILFYIDIDKNDLTDEDIARARIYFHKKNTIKTQKKPVIETKNNKINFHSFDKLKLISACGEQQARVRYVYEADNFTDNFDRASIVIANSNYPTAKTLQMPIKAFIPKPTACNATKENSLLSLNGRLLDEVKFVLVNTNIGKKTVPVSQISEDGSVLTANLPPDISQVFSVSGITCDGEDLIAFNNANGFKITNFPSGPICNCPDCFETNTVNLPIPKVNTISPEEIPSGELSTITLTGTTLGNITELQITGPNNRVLRTPVLSNNGAQITFQASLSAGSYSVAGILGEGPCTEPSAEPSSEPSSEPSEEPSGGPSSDPSSFPSEDPSSFPSEEPSGFPSEDPSPEPSASSSSEPQENCNLTNSLSFEVNDGGGGNSGQLTADRYFSLFFNRLYNTAALIYVNGGIEGGKPNKIYYFVDVAPQSAPAVIDDFRAAFGVYLSSGERNLEIESLNINDSASGETQSARNSDIFGLFDDNPANVRVVAIPWSPRAENANYNFNFGIQSSAALDINGQFIKFAERDDFFSDSFTGSEFNGSAIVSSDYSIPAYFSGDPNTVILQNNIDAYNVDPESVFGP